jgi:hypothetical protein
MPKGPEELKLKYLEVIIALLLQSRDASRQPSSAKEQISTLSLLGLDSTEIGRILGRDAAQVSKDLYKIRQGRKGKAQGAGSAE